MTRFTLNLLLDLRIRLMQRIKPAYEKGMTWVGHETASNREDLEISEVWNKLYYP